MEHMEQECNCKDPTRVCKCVHVRERREGVSKGRKEGGKRVKGGSEEMCEWTVCLF